MHGTSTHPRLPKSSDRCRWRHGNVSRSRTQLFTCGDPQRTRSRPPQAGFFLVGWVLVGAPSLAFSRRWLTLLLQAQQGEPVVEVTCSGSGRSRRRVAMHRPSGTACASLEPARSSRSPSLDRSKPGACLSLITRGPRGVPTRSVNAPMIWEHRREVAKLRPPWTSVAQVRFLPSTAPEPGSFSRSHPAWQPVPAHGPGEQGTLEQALRGGLRVHRVSRPRCPEARGRGKPRMQRMKRMESEGA